MTGDPAYGRAVSAPSDSQTRSALMQGLLLDLWQHAHKTVAVHHPRVDEAILPATAFTS